ncbi:MAG: choice-of-anchor D domain-containing protein [Candidatus Latescibacterota bacterium]|nr:choice-of-anchor D domain-containing protein [Candidatus Latescibacterota bacterium]
MSRGKKVFFSGLVLMGLGSFLMHASPVEAHDHLVTSDAVAGEDNLAPHPVGEVSVEADLGDVSVDVYWTLADDDFVRQAPTTGDLSSGGGFVNVNDVAGYVVWRSVVGEEPEELAVVSSGETFYTDDTVSAGLSYSYLVTSIDGSGNESEAVESTIVNLGPPPKVETEVPEDVVIKTVATLTLGGELTIEPFVAEVVEVPPPPPAATVEEIDDYLEEIEEEQQEVLSALEPEQKEAALAFRDAIADAAGIDPRRIIIKSVTSGSIIVDFEIIDLGQIDEDAEDEFVSPADALSDLSAALEENPETFAEDPALASIAEDIGAVEEIATALSSEIDFGVVDPSDIVTEVFTFVNNADDPEAVLTVSSALSGPGFTVSDPLDLSVGESGDVEISFDASLVGDVNGDYSGLLTIYTNDPNNRVTDIDLFASIEDGLEEGSLVVSGAVPANFGSVIIGASQTREIEITNDGDLTLSGDVMVEGDAGFAVDVETFSLEGGEVQVVTVTFTPTLAETAAGELVITSDDADNLEVIVALSGTGAEAGDQQILVDADGVQIFGDIDGNGTVDFDDFFQFADNFGLASPDPVADFDGNGVVDFDDFFLFADNFGKSGTYVSAG